MTLTKLEKKRWQEKGLPLSLYATGDFNKYAPHLKTIRNEINRERREFVQREVLLRVCRMVAAVTSHTVLEQLSLKRVLDYEDGTAIWRGQPTLDDYREAIDDDHKVYQPNIHVAEWAWSNDHEEYEGFSSELEAYKDCFDSYSGDHPEGREVMAHYVVSDQLARRLEAHGEIVARDFLGLTIWGRCTSGQNVEMDGVIQTIYEEIHCKDTPNKGEEA